MEEKPNVLFVVFEGLAATVIDAQVLTHVRELSMAGIASFEVWVVAWNDEMYERSVARLEASNQLAQSRVRVFRGVKPASFGSVRKNGLVLLNQAASEGKRFTHIHARTDYAVLPCAVVAKAMGATLIWDCRGDAVAEVDYRKDLKGPMSVLRVLLRLEYRRRLSAAAKLCDRALFVSTPLRSLVMGRLYDKPSFVVPSCASERDFFFDPELRRISRENMGYVDSDQVYVYSGGVQAYQRFNEMLMAFALVAARNPRARLLIATPDDLAAESAVRAILEAGTWQVRSVPLSEVNAVLNAADVAFLLRHDTPTNRSASPTKFAEYCLAGLPVIMTRAIVDSWELANRSGNLVEFDEATGMVGDVRVFDRKALAMDYRARLGKTAFLDTYRQVYAIH